MPSIRHQGTSHYIQLLLAGAMSMSARPSSRDPLFDMATLSTELHVVTVIPVAASEAAACGCLPAAAWASRDDGPPLSDAAAACKTGGCPYFSSKATQGKRNCLLPSKHVHRRTRQASACTASRVHAQAHIAALRLLAIRAPVI